MIIPQGLLHEERTAALALLSSCPEHAQALLDELAARLQSNAVRVSPVAYLRGMIARAQAGTFAPEQGIRIAEARRQREAEEGLRRGQAVADERGAQERASPAYQEKLAQRRADIRRMLDATRMSRSQDEAP